MCGVENARTRPVSQKRIRALEEEAAELDEAPDQHESGVDGKGHHSRSEDLAKGVAVGQLHRLESGRSFRRTMRRGRCILAAAIGFVMSDKKYYVKLREPSS